MTALWVVHLLNADGQGQISLTSENVFPRAVDGQTPAGTSRLHVCNRHACCEHALQNERRKADMAFYVRLSPVVHHHVAKPNLTDRSSLEFCIPQRPEVSSAHQVAWGLLGESPDRRAVNADNKNVVDHLYSECYSVSLKSAPL